MPAVETFLDDEKQYFYREINPEAKKTLILLHGWNTVGSGSWRSFLELFENSQFHVLAPDLPGFAKTPVPPKIWLAQDYAIWLQQFLQKYSSLTGKNLNNFYLMGHSFGGGIATIFTSQNNSVQKLILASPAIVRKPKTQNLRKKQKITKFGKKVFNLPIFNLFFELAKKIWYKLLKSEDYYKSKPIMKQILAKVVRDDLQNYLTQIQISTLAIWGDLDQMTPISDLNLIEQKIDSKLFQKEIYEGINHGLHLHATENLAESVKDFLQD